MSMKRGIRLGGFVESIDTAMVKIRKSVGADLELELPWSAAMQSEAGQYLAG